MAAFECIVYKLKIEEHPNADALELAVVGDYRSIVRKDQFKTGDLGVYIPEAAIVPDWLIEDLGLTGRLAGKQKNRVKAVKLRGILSQGLIVPLVEYPFHTNIDEVGYDAKGMTLGLKKVVTNAENMGDREVYSVTFAPEGTDVTEYLGITKYEPVIPTCMNGEVWNAFGLTLKYDIENFKKFPDVINECTDRVTFTEKLHGTWACFGYHPDSDIPVVTSKGLSEKGLAFKFNEVNDNNLYVSTFKSLDREGVDILEEFVMAMGYDWDSWSDLPGADQPFYILGEIFGKGVQDLAYGTDKKLFRVFDIYVGLPGKGRYLNTYEVMDICNQIDSVEYVPVLYSGPFYKAEMERFTDGKETVSGNETCIREGIVVRLEEEGYDPALGRIILKSVSEKYLLRKNATEYN